MYLPRESPDYLEFRQTILPAIERDDRATVHELHVRLEALVERVVALNEMLKSEGSPHPLKGVRGEWRLTPSCDG